MWRSSIVGLFVLGAPVIADASEISLSFGATVASEYASNGIRYSDGVVVQPYVELGYGGLYAGAYLSNVNETLTAAHVEYGLSLGYRGEAGRFSYDVGLAYYMYTEAFPDLPVADYPEAYVIGTLAATDTLYVTAEASVAPEYEQTDLSLTLDYYTPVEGVSVGATVGRLDADYGAWTYWSVGAAYQASDTILLGVSWEDTNVNPDLGLADTDGLFVATITFNFSLR